MSFFGKTEKEILEAMGYDASVPVKSMENYKFPEVVVSRTQAILGCTDEEMEMVQIGLLDYFLTLKVYGPLEMIDKKADELWHVFLWDTKGYMEFCANYMGRFVHHTPYMDEKEMSEEDLTLLKTRYKKALVTDSKYATRRDNTTSNYSNNHNNDDMMMWLPIYAMSINDDAAAVEAVEAARAAEIVELDKWQNERIADISAIPDDVTEHSSDTYSPSSNPGHSDSSYDSGSSYSPSSYDSGSSYSSSCSSGSSSSCGSSCGGS